MFINIGDIKTHVEKWGQGEDLLLLHGWGQGVTLDAHLSPLALKLCDDYRVTAIEFPGHGQTGDPTADWSVSDFTAFVVAVLDQLKLDRVTVIAHSFGGRVAIKLATGYPERVKRLIITGGAGIKKPANTDASRRQKRYKRLRNLANVLAHVPGLRGLADKAREALVQRYGSADYKALKPSLRPTFVKVINEDLSPLLPSISCPTLLIWGDKDDATPLWMAQQMEREIPDSALIVFEGQGHFAYLTDLSRFALIVRAFIKEDVRL